MELASQAPSSASPHDLQGWLALAQTYRPVILDDSVSACQDLSQDASANIPRLTGIVLADPGLALHLLSDANRKLASKGRQPAATVNHIALLQGLPAVLASTAQLTTLNRLPATARSGLLRGFNRAWHTAILLREWGQRYPVLASEEAFLDGLLHHLPEQFLWQCAPGQAALLETIEAGTDGATRAEQERAILGCSRDELGAGLAGAWHLGQDLRDSFRGDLPAHQTTPLAIRHAAILMRLSEWGWYGTAMNRALDACVAALGFAPERLTALLHHAAASAAREAVWHYPGVCPSAWLLPDLPGLPASLHPQTREDQPVTTPADTPPPSPAAQPSAPSPAAQPSAPSPAAQPSAAPAPGNDGRTDKAGDSAARQQELLRQHLDELEQAASAGLKPQDCIVLGLRTLVEGAGFERASICLLNKTRDALHVRFSQAPESTSLLQGRVFDIRTANLLRALMQKPQRIYIDAGNRARYHPMLPDELRRNALEGEMALMSIYIKNKPLGVLLAETTSLGSIQRRVFKHVGQLIIKTIQTQNS